jgi:hypothetical protein
MAGAPEVAPSVRVTFRRPAGLRVADVLGLHADGGGAAAAARDVGAEISRGETQIQIRRRGTGKGHRRAPSRTRRFLPPHPLAMPHPV